MFQLLTCSNCSRTYSLRKETSESALLKCPNCGNQFRLGDHLDAFFPSWKVIEDPGIIDQGSTLGNSAAHTSGRIDGSHNHPLESTLGFSAASARRSTVDSESEDANEFELPEGIQGEIDERLQVASDGLQDLEIVDEEDEGSEAAATPTVEWSKFKPITHEDYQRAKRNTRSPVWSIVQVVLGGLAAIPVSLLLIWHLLGKDVAGAGPAVGKYIPWIVPEKFRPYPEDDFTPVPRTSRRRGAALVEDEELADSSPMARKSTSPSEEVETNVNRSTDPTTSMSPEVKPTSSEAKPGEDSKSNSSTPKPESPIPSDPSPSKPTNASSDATKGETSDPNLFDLVRSAREQVIGWASIDVNDRVKLAAELKKLGATFAQIGSEMNDRAALATQRIIRDHLQDVLKSLKRQESIVDGLTQLMKAQASGRVPLPEKGRFLIVTLGSVEEVDEIWRCGTNDDSTGDLKDLQIEVPREIAPQLTSGQRLFLLGTIAPDSKRFQASFSYGL